MGRKSKKEVKTRLPISISSKDMTWLVVKLAIAVTALYMAYMSGKQDGWLEATKVYTEIIFSGPAPGSQPHLQYE